MGGLSGRGRRPPGRAALAELGPFVAGFFVVVVVAAGASGVALLLAPGATHRYFSWTLRPSPAAALVGGFYLASAVVFAWALTLPWRQARSLVVGVLGLAVPTLVLTLVHDEVFDFGRWQAGAWVALFVTAPVSATAILLLRPRPGAGGPALHPRWRVALAALAAALAVVSVLVWLDATRDDVSRAGPFDLVRLTGTYLGAWCSFLAVLAGWAAVRGRGDDARVPLGTGAAAGGGAAIAVARTAGDLRRPVAALAVALGVLARAALAYRRNAPGPAGAPGPPR